MKNILGFIGGSGLYDLDFLENKQLLDLKSPWGESSDKIIQGSINENIIFFLSRHGEGHKISPTSINYQANIDCLKQCGVTDLVSLSAVGSLKESFSPGTFVIVDQFIDRTINRKNSFFTEGIVAHVPMDEPTSKELMLLSKKVLDELSINSFLASMPHKIISLFLLQVCLSSGVSIPLNLIFSPFKLIVSPSIILISYDLTSL